MLFLCVRATGWHLKSLWNVYVLYYSPHHPPLAHAHPTNLNDNDSHSWQVFENDNDSHYDYHSHLEIFTIFWLTWQEIFHIVKFSKLIESVKISKFQKLVTNSSKYYRMLSGSFISILSNFLSNLTSTIKLCQSPQIDI